MSCSLRAANINSPRCVPYPVRSRTRRVRRRAVRARSVRSLYGCPPVRRSTAARLLSRRHRARRLRRRPFRPGGRPAYRGSTTPVVAAPQSAPSARRTPAAICRATSASTAPRAARSSASTPRTSLLRGSHKPSRTRGRPARHLVRTSAPPRPGRRSATRRQRGSPPPGEQPQHLGRGCHRSASAAPRFPETRSAPPGPSEALPAVPAPWEAP